MENKEYTIDEVMCALINLPEGEKDILTKCISINDLTRIGNDVKLFQDCWAVGKDQARWWRDFESGLANLMIALKDKKNVQSDEIFPGISKKLFGKMVSVVTDITQREQVLIEKRLYNTLGRFSKINTFEADAIMLKTNGIEIKSNVLDMIKEIVQNWGHYIDIEKLCITKAIVGVTYVENVETFYDLMENWDKIMS